jgi:Tol biopolymer transport system component
LQDEANKALAHDRSNAGKEAPMLLASHQPRRTRLVLCAAAAAVIVPASALYAPPGGNGKGNGNGGGDDPPPDPAIVYNAGGDIGVMNADGSNRTLVLAGAGSSIELEPGFSPDGTRIVFNGDVPPLGPGVYVIDVDGAGLELVTPLAREGLGGPVWSPVPTPDGVFKILFADEDPASGSFDLFVVNLDGSGLHNLTDTPDREELHPSWAPTGAAIVCGGFSVVPGTSFYNCFVYELDVIDGALTVIANESLVDVPGSPLQDNHGLAWPDWSRTANIIAVSASTQCCSTWDIWLIDLFDPANPINITGDSRSAERQPTWSPDDAKIAYWKTSGKSGIFIMNADGSGRTKLSGSGRSPDWRRY